MVNIHANKKTMYDIAEQVINTMLFDNRRYKMKMKIAFFVIAATVICFAVAGAQSSGKVLTFKGYKNIEIGMKIKSVAKATGLVFSFDSPPEKNECTYAYSKSLPGLYLMLVNEVVARIDVDNGDYTTAEGARLGDSEATIKKLYPKV